MAPCECCKMVREVFDGKPIDEKLNCTLLVLNPKSQWSRNFKSIPIDFASFHTRLLRRLLLIDLDPLCLKLWVQV